MGKPTKKKAEKNNLNRLIDSKEKDTILFHAICNQIKNNWLFQETNLSLTDKQTIIDEIDEINKQITARNLLAKKLGLKKEDKESKIKWIKYYETQINDKKFR